MKSNEDESASVMLSISKNEYGSSYQDHFFEQYKLYVEMADKISERRANANSFFFTVITALISIIGMISGFGTQAANVFSSWIIDFQHFHIVLYALYPSITTSAHYSRIAPNGWGSNFAICSVTSCR